MGVDEKGLLSGGKIGNRRRARFCLKRFFINGNVQKIMGSG